MRLPLGCPVRPRPESKGFRVAILAGTLDWVDRQYRFALRIDLGDFLPRLPAIPGIVGGRQDRFSLGGNCASSGRGGCSSLFAFHPKGYGCSRGSLSSIAPSASFNVAWFYFFSRFHPILDCHGAATSSGSRRDWGFLRPSNSWHRRSGSKAGPFSQNDVFTFVTMATFHCCVLIWFFYLVSKEPVRRSVGEIPSNDLEVWDRELARMLHG